MEKGLIVMIAVFVMIGIVHFLSLRMDEVSVTTKSKIRKIFWYFYGAYSLFYGIVRNIEENWNVIGIIFTVIGLLILILNFLGKIETRSNWSRKLI